MPNYIDGYLLPVPKKNLAAYRAMAVKAGKIWREHGALEYRECVGEDLNVKWGIPFPRRFKLKAGETMISSWIVSNFRAHRDRLNRKVLNDPRIENMSPNDAPFDCAKMGYGGFTVIVDL